MNIRMAADGSATIEGVLVPFDGSFNDGRDSYGTKFSARTDYRLDWFTERPLLYNHGLNTGTGKRGTESEKDEEDEGPGLDPVGRIRSLEVRPEGVWMQAQLDKGSKYFDQIRSMVEAGKLFLSSSTLEHLVKVNRRSGEVEQWPIVEGSMTPTPSNLLATIPYASFRSHATELGIEIPDEETLTDDETGTRAKKQSGEDAADEQGDEPGDDDAADEDNLDDDQFAYIDSSGDRKLRIDDAKHVRLALAMFNRTDFDDPSEKPAAMKRILNAAKKFGIDTTKPSRSAAEQLMFERLDFMAEQLEAIEAQANYDGAFRSDDENDPFEGEELTIAQRSFEDIRSDIAGQLNRTSPFGYDAPWSTIVATFPTSVRVKRYDDEGETSWDIPYELNDQNTPVLGEPVQLDEAYVPSRSYETDGSIIDEAESLSRHAVAFAKRTQDLGARRSAEGRTVSASNANALQGSVALTRTATDTLDAAVRSVTEPSPSEAQANPEEKWTMQQRELELLNFTLSEE